MNRAGVGAVALGAMLLAGCDRSTDASETSPAPSPTTSTSTSTTVAGPAPSTTTRAAVASTDNDPTTVAPVATSLGPLRFDLPADAVIDPRRRSPLPEFVAANQRWIVPGTVNLSVTIETIIPPMPADELIDEFDANGLTWHVFDSGPRNGSLVIAITTIDTMAVLISAQSWTWDPTDVPRGYVDDLARTVQHQAP